MNNAVVSSGNNIGNTYLGSNKPVDASAVVHGDDTDVLPVTNQAVPAVLVDITHNTEVRNGQTVTVKPMPRNCHGPLPNNTYDIDKQHVIFKQLQGFFEGTQSLDDIKESFRKTVVETKDYLYNNGFGAGGLQETEQVIADTYKLFRFEMLAAANYACATEGRIKYGIEDPTVADFKYYNSDYYFLTEELKIDLGDLSQQVGQSFGVQSVDLSYASPPSFMSDNFNTAWGTGSPACILDSTAQPPKDFAFFYDSNYERGFGEIMWNGQSYRFNNQFVGQGYSLHYNRVSDVIDLDFTENSVFKNFVRNICFFDVSGAILMSTNGFFATGRGIFGTA